jgi:hypothetical protein
MCSILRSLFETRSTSLNIGRREDAGSHNAKLGSGCSVHSEMLIGADRSIRQAEPAALATADHGIDRVAEKPACGGTMTEFAVALQELPGELE